jgi:predicted molibdopterin-dependent oxidoreductase YjgC
MDIAVVDGRIAGVRGREDDRVNRGRLDPKDLYGWQANNSPDRLTRPLVRRGGELVESDWDEAVGVVVERTRELLAEPATRTSTTATPSPCGATTWPRPRPCSGCGCWTVGAVPIRRAWSRSIRG